ncbi:helix-turn-helix domain-containing protein [Actinomadura sp. HBU206391]|uniref:helix-turn-helix domain-containing protein n=1 Tax=Actinomadura sp. HBU206391 TaxID=2731692 RepID=UPI00164F46B2|nr:helix-turn-helix transcriptional regulator [Actinomadura sp. HBU206391]MBC6461322.1 helix-turn-helix domain-containing protein [Actinomadura sp. HBU206391]
MPGEHVSSVSSRRLGRELRGLREAREISCDRAAAELGRAPIWLVEIESGHERITVAELRGLLDLYAVTDEGTRDHLTDLAHRCGGPAWLKRHTGWLSELERDFIILESEATNVRAYGIGLIPDLQRTEAYARATYSAALLPGDTVTVEQRLDLLLSRQRHQTDGEPRRSHVVLDESAISHPIGGAQTMLGQLRHLAEHARQDHAVVQLIPREVGAHPGLDGSFHILDFSVPAEPSVSISQSALGPLLSYVPLDDHFQMIADVALSPADSLFLIEQAIGEF